MTRDELLKPTLHVEVLVASKCTDARVLKEIREEVAVRVQENYDSVQTGQEVTGFADLKHESLLTRVEVADYTGPLNPTGFYVVVDAQLDVQAYTLQPERDSDTRRTIAQDSEEDEPRARIHALPNAALDADWNSLVFDDALPARLLRYLVRMVGMMGQPGLNLSTFNWNRLCLLHGPPGSGKSTLCRALAQKLSIRLGDTFSNSTLVEMNTNTMLSKYFGESGKLIGAMFDRVQAMAQDVTCFVSVVIDEVETIAGSREKSTSGMECSDGLRATNQLLTALDRLRNLPNVIVLCTSNLIEAIDPAFLDRIDIKQLIPSPSPEAIYNIFRSCINELIRSKLVSASTTPPTDPAPAEPTPHKARRANRPSTSTPVPTPTTPTPSTAAPALQIPTYPETRLLHAATPTHPGARVWRLAQQCQGFSGRTLRRLPILGLAMYTWGGACGVAEAVGALERAVEQELVVVGGKGVGVGAGG